MKHFAVILLGTLSCAGHAGAQTLVLPSAPDMALAGGVVVTNALDYTSTLECLRRPYAQCHEGVLPTALVQNKAGFGLYKAAVTGLEIYGQHALARRGHPRLARLVQSVNVTLTAETVGHNYYLDTQSKGNRLVLIGAK